MNSLKLPATGISIWISWPEFEILVGMPENKGLMSSSQTCIITWSLKEFLALDTVFLFRVRVVLDLTGVLVTTLCTSGCWEILGEGKDCV